jgi:hypothetical protein
LSATHFIATNISQSAAQHGFSVKEYEEFHDVLHPLEHDALPKKDYRRIRANAGELVKRGRAIVKVGVPPATSEDQKQAFSEGLKKFGDALRTRKERHKRSTQSVL